MASLRVVLGWSSRSSFLRRSLHSGSTPFVGNPSVACRFRPPQVFSPVSSGPRTYNQQRWHSAPPTKTKVYDFEDIRNFSQNPSADRILIDVREPGEYSAGYIPTAYNVPVKSQPDAWFLPPDEFEDRFGFPKPDTSKNEVVFYCRAGVRSSAAASLAEQGGYERVGEYRGSWLDWEKRGGETKT